jgi:hypothetical protein
MSYGFQARTGERNGGLGRTSERRDGEIHHGFRISSRRDDPDPAVTGECARAIGCAGDCGAQSETDPLQTRPDHLQQRRFSAQEMLAPGDVEDQPVRRIEGNERGPAVAVIGQTLQEQGIGRRIEIRDGKAHYAGPCIGERQPRPEPEPEGACIDGCEPQRPLDVLGEDERGLIRRAGLPLPNPPEPFGRQEWEPQGEIAARPC